MPRPRGRRRAVEPAAQRDEAAGGSLVAGSGDQRAEQPDGDDPLGQLVAAGQRVGPTAGQPDDHEPLVAEVIRHRADVDGPVGQLPVGVVGGVAHPRTLNAYHPETEVFRRGPSHRRDLSTGAGRAVEPEHQRSPGITELGVTEAPTVR